ncbi:MAG TPA: hypothetical protein VJ858_01065 [Acidimicrobiia bacterium]|nr:hypothetical protein [Acidimicrobiia bacterium]
MSREEPTPRQVLYALVAAGFLVVVSILTVGAMVSSLVPPWWTVVVGSSIVVAGIWVARGWRRTGPVLTVAIGLFVIWTVGTLVLAT